MGIKKKVLGVTTLCAPLGSAWHRFIASEHPSVHLVIQRERAPATLGQPPPRGPRPGELKAQLTLVGPGKGHPHADVRRGLWIASGLRSPRLAPPGWGRGAPGGLRGATTAVAAGIAGRLCLRLLQRLLPRRDDFARRHINLGDKDRRRCYWPWGQRE